MLRAVTVSSERAELFLRGHRSTLYTHPGTKLKAKPPKGRRAYGVHSLREGL